MTTLNELDIDAYTYRGPGGRTITINRVRSSGGQHWQFRIGDLWSMAFLSQHNNAIHKTLGDFENVKFDRREDAQETAERICQHYADYADVLDSSQASLKARILAEYTARSKR